MRRGGPATVVVLGLLGLGGCDSPTEPGSGLPARPPLEPFAGQFSLSGIVVGNQDRVPVAGARLVLGREGMQPAVTTTDAAGRFDIPAVPQGAIDVSLDASGYVPHASTLYVTGSRGDIELDLISMAPPFSLDFYRQLARDGFDASRLRQINPWIKAPRFYIRTITDDTGEPVPSDVIDGIRRVFLHSVPELSNQRFQMAAFETGTASRSPEDGWVRVSFVGKEDVLGPGIAGRATVGGQQGQITLLYERADLRGRNHHHECEWYTVWLAEHEIMHTMGFFHTETTYLDFETGPGCPGQGRPARVLSHAAVMYSRPPGNSDPDTDPQWFVRPVATRPTEASEVACALPVPQR